MLSSVQFAVVAIDRESADGSFFLSPTRSVSLVEYSRVPAAFRARQLGLLPALIDSGRRHRAGGAIDVEDVNAATVAGRQINLGWQHIVQRGTERSDVGDERFGAACWPRREQIGDEEQADASEISFRVRTPYGVE